MMLPNTRIVSMGRGMPGKVVSCESKQGENRLLHMRLLLFPVTPQTCWSRASSSLRNSTNFTCSFLRVGIGLVFSKASFFRAQSSYKWLILTVFALSLPGFSCRETESQSKAEGSTGAREKFRRLNENSGEGGDG